MSLQGSLDTFALPDVLVLLASTKKTGELHVTGSRNPEQARTSDLQGLLWVTDGQLVGHDVARAPDAATAVFELLRLQEGSFSFVSGAPDHPQPPLEIEPLLGEAQAYLSEWRDIEQVVPSLSAWLRLAPQAPAAHVSMRAEQWRLVVAIGGGCEVSRLVEHLGQGELLGCRSIKELAESGLLDISIERMPNTSLGMDTSGAPDNDVAIENSTPDFGRPGGPSANPGRTDFFGNRAAAADLGGLSPEPSAGELEATPFASRGLSQTPRADAFGSAGGTTGSGDSPTDSGFGQTASGFSSSRSMPDDRGDAYGSSALHAAADEAAALHATPQAVGDDDVMSAITDFDSLASLPSRAKKNRATVSPMTDGAPEPRPTLSSIAGERAETVAEGQLPETQALARQLGTLGDDPPPAGHPAGTPSTSGTSAEGVDGDVDGDEPLNRGLLLKFLSSVRN